LDLCIKQKIFIFSQFIGVILACSHQMVPLLTTYGLMTQIHMPFPLVFFYHCWLAGELHEFELPEGAIRPNYEHVRINVHGCGLVLDPVDKLCIFFTLNGKLKGELVLENWKLN
jgi:hypothetical protein